MSATTTLRTLTLRVASTTEVASRIVAIELESIDGTELPTWEPGSHVDVHLGDLVRQYSLSIAPESGRWRLGVLREHASRGGSEYAHTGLRVGDDLQVSEPRNTFPFAAGSRPILFVAGGIGITPILSMAARAQSEGHDWSLLYLTRSTDAAAFAEELVTAYGERARLHHDDAHGVIDLEAELDRLGAPGCDVYACGPTGLLDALEDYRKARPSTRLVVERFTNDGAGPRDSDTAFIVELGDGTEVEVAADETVLHALNRAGVPILSSCQEGICGTCETAVLFGTPDHRDHVLSDEEKASGEMMMPCVSRCRGNRLGLDL